MPELPEVETICRTVEPKILNSRFVKIEQRNNNLRNPVPEDLGAKIINKEIIKIDRRAKYMLVYFADGLVMIMHFGMSGKITFPNSDEQLQKHDHFIAELDNGLRMVYNDARRFGSINYMQDRDLASHKYFVYLGPEPLSKKFDAKYLYEISRKRVMPIKNFIMDQKIVVGVGNIYAAEALFLTSIHPAVQAGKLSKKQCEEFVRNIKVTLEKAIIAGGSSISDYVNSDNESGYFQHEFQVYGRENKPCYRCANPIERITQAGRSSFYCSKCQPL